MTSATFAAPIAGSNARIRALAFTKAEGHDLNAGNMWRHPAPRLDGG